MKTINKSVLVAKKNELNKARDELLVENKSLLKPHLSVKEQFRIKAVRKELNMLNGKIELIDELLVM
jgi:hypothetical protein